MMDDDDLLKRLDHADLYDCGGEVSELPEDATACIRELAARLACSCCADAIFATIKEKTQ